MEIKLRDYQEKDLAEILMNIEFEDIKMQCIYGSVSYGKSHIIAALCKEYHGTIFISLPYTDLVEQVEETLLSMNISYSVILSGHPAKFNPNERIQIALDSSYYAGINDKYSMVKASLICVDEFHVRIDGKRFQSIKSKLQSEYIVGLSGTPYKPSGRGFYGVTIVSNVTHRELIERGYVANVETYVSNLYLQNGFENKATVNENDYSDEELSLMYSKKSIKTMVDQYEEFCEIKDLEPRETKTLWFATNVKACEAIANELISRGYHAFAYHGSTKFASEIMESYRNNTTLKQEITLFNFDNIEQVEVKHLVSVNKLTTGFSVDDIQIGIMTAPSKRLPTTVQRFGRLSRKNGDMPKYFIDFGGSSVTFGDFQEHFTPLPPDASNEEVKEYMAKRGLKNSKFLFHKHHLVPSTQDTIDRNIEEFNESINGLRLGEMRLGQLLDKWYLEDNIDELILIFLAFVKTAYSEPMQDKWGRDTVGYTYKKYDNESQNYDTKTVSGFYNEKTAQWLLEIYYKVIEKYPEKKDHWLKAMKTKMYNISKMRQFEMLKDGVVTTEEFEDKYKQIQESIYALRFFPEFLEKKHLEEIEDMKQENDETNKTLPEIDIDEDIIPF